MRHIFILNPAAGGGRANRLILPQIVGACKEAGVDYEIHRTMSLGDAGNFTGKRAREAGGNPVRFYACGGDGTLNEVLNGLIGFDNAELGVIPTGTGNDFVRNFRGQGPVGGGKLGNRGDRGSDGGNRFLDIGAQIRGETAGIDCIEYECNESVKGYALNMFNLGFDAQAVAKAAKYKRRPFMNGTTAYIAGVLDVLIRLKSVEMRVEFGDTDFPAIDGDFLLAGITNGRFSGGGFDGTPQARINDGLLDITLISKMSRRFFLSLLKSYHDGTHVENPKLKGIYRHFQAKSVTLLPKEKVIMAIDGETVEIGAVRFSLREKSVNMVIPEGVEVISGVWGGGCD